MKTISLFLSTFITYLFLISIATPMSSCTKTEFIRDTITVRDTLTIRDTLRITDTSACCNLNEGMVAHYTFTNGSLKDSSGLNNDIILNNAATSTTDRFGVAKNAYVFNGTGSYMKVKNSESLNNLKTISLMAIVKVNGFYTGKCHANQILGKGYNDFANSFYNMRFYDINTDCDAAINPDKEAFSASFGDNNPLGKAAATLADTSFIRTSQWYNVIYTYDGIESRLYINGVLSDIRVKKATTSGSTFDLFIGKHEDPSYPYYFNGVIDEIRIYNKALCSDQILKLNNLKN
jgi:hypothetical protein